MSETATITSTFSQFGENVHNQYTRMEGWDLFEVDIPDIFDQYLSFYPEGSNPVYKERTEHDCNCCKNFIRNLGRVVYIGLELDLVTVWDNWEGLAEPYRTVGERMSLLVKSAPIKDAYYTKEGGYGAKSTFSTTDNRIWNHFYGKVFKSCQTSWPETPKGTIRAYKDVAKRGLEEIATEAISTVIDLISDPNQPLYRGQEFRGVVEAFQRLKATYDKTPDGLKDRLVWINARNNSVLSTIRNSVIGTLLVDISKDVDVDKAVRSFEAKVDPANYKRPAAIVTPKMVDQALAKLESIGVPQEAIYRRYANIQDVSINDVLFADRSSMKHMKGGLADLISSSVKPKGKKIPAGATEITGEDFIGSVIPSAKQISVVLENRHLGNFVSLTTAREVTGARLFKWDNDFAWSYDGDLADSDMKKAVARAGGSVTGVLRFTHQWNHVGRNASLMDLHVFMPGCRDYGDGCHDNYPRGHRVGWNRRTDIQSGGVQDVDYVKAAPPGYVPVENITFPDLGRLWNGNYVFKIHNWSHRNPTNSGFRAEIEFGGQIFRYEHDKPLANKEWVTLAVVTLKDGVFTIDHKHPTAEASSVPVEKWGLTTGTTATVETIMLSPNHWYGQSVGNKHLFFFLRGCQNPGQARGIYNEFLRSELDPHRKVFETIGSLTKTERSDQQLSGLGFSSTRKDEVNVLVDGRPYLVKF